MSAARRLQALREPVAPAPMPKRLGGRGSGPIPAFAPPGPGERLDGPVRGAMEQAFGHDFSSVRIHRDPQAAFAARAMGAAAFASGTHIGFARDRYEPATGAGRALLAHELAHVVQQCGSGRPSGGAAAESEADAAADAFGRGAPVPPLGAVAPQIQRRVELRDVGRGEQSGVARRQELVNRLNSISTALIFSVDAAGVLSYTENPYGTETDFDRKMKAFIDSGAVLPLRLTNRHGLLRSTPGGPHDSRVDADAWASGYVDVDDMLASDDLGFQVVLVHFLTERAATRNYARRIGTLDDTSREFDRAHDSGVAAEVELLRDFFGDPTIQLRRDGGGAGGVFRTYRNSRGDTIRARTPPAPRGQFGLDANLMDVRLRDGTIMSVHDYRDLLRREEEAAARRRLLELRGSPRIGPAP